MSNAYSLIPVKSAGCGPLAQGFYKQGLLEDEYHMKKGDIVFFNWSNGAESSNYVPFPSVDHVGIVAEVGTNGNFTSVEGNTGTTNNGEVMQRSRNIKDVSCVAHPKYDSTFTASKIISTAKAEVGTKATNVKRCKYNTWFYGTEVSGEDYDWCAAFVCWVFAHTESNSSSGGSTSTSTAKSNKAIDVSSWQGDSIDWYKVKAAGYSYALLKIGAGDLASQKDSCFDINYKNAKAAGLKVGGYWYSYCTIDGESSDNTTDAKLEAEACLACLKGKTLDLPVYYDLEESKIAAKGKTACTSIAKTFCDTIVKGGFKAGIYANLNWFKNYLDYSTLKKSYSIWLAEWSSSKSLDCDIWQYSETGSVNGISGNVDLDIVYSESGGGGSVDPEPALTSNFTYKVRSGGKWYPEVTDLEDYAGVQGIPITDVAIKVSQGTIKYRVHIKGGTWLDYVTGYDTTDDDNGYAGDRKPIDAIEVYWNSPSGQNKAKYRVSPNRGEYYDWQYDNETSGDQDGYAGEFGTYCDRFQIVAS